MALFSCCSCDPAAEEETQTQFGPSLEGAQEVGEEQPLTAEQKQKEKERLQALVKLFAKSAVSGPPCVFLDVSANKKISCRYFLNKTLSDFSLHFASGIQHSFPLKSLREVYSLPALQSNASTASLCENPSLKCLDSSSQDCVLMIEYQDGAAAPLNRLFLIEEGGKEARDRFITCLKVLALYAQSTT